MRDYACYFIENLPDMTMSKYQALAESDVGGLLNLEKMFLRQWAAICELYDLTLHLFISYNREKAEGKQLDIFLVFCGEDESLANVEQILKGSSLREYFTLLKDQERAKRVEKQQFSAACTLTKRERKIISKPSENSLTQQGETPLYFVPSWEMNEDARLIDMIHMMESLPDDSAYRVDIFPQRLTEKTRGTPNCFCTPPPRKLSKRESIPSTTYPPAKAMQ